jgi:hypothetical protein
MEKLVFAFSVESSIVVSELFEGDLFFTVTINKIYEQINGKITKKI